MAIAPDTVQVKVTPMHGGQGYGCPIQLPASHAALPLYTLASCCSSLSVCHGFP